MEKTRRVVLLVGLLFIFFPMSVAPAYPTLLNGTFDSDLSGWTVSGDVAFESDVLTWPNPPGQSFITDGHALFFDYSPSASLSQLFVLDTTQTLTMDVVMRLPGDFSETDAISASVGDNVFYTRRSNNTADFAFGASPVESAILRDYNDDGSVRATWVYDRVMLPFSGPAFANGDYLLSFNTLPAEGSTLFALDNITITTPAVMVPAPAALVLGGIGAAGATWLRRRKVL